MKTISLDIHKNGGLTKSFTGRVSDKGDVLNVLLTDGDTQLVMNTVSQVVLKGQQSNSSYLSVNGTKTTTGATFKIPATFNNTEGYFNTAYVEITLITGEVLSTQPFIYSTYNDARIQ